ncbi:MAG: DUF998 domain-containing protein [Gemmatimonadaceae bacterium]
MARGNRVNYSRSQRLLLTCGVLAAVGYVGTDICASALYPGYSYSGQAVSELFAIGAPTSPWVVPLLTLWSLCLLAFALGVWRAAGSRRLIRALALMFAGSAVIGLLLWNAFPMHMRGAQRSFTDTMHLILAANPFVLLSLILAIIAFRGAFRVYSVISVLMMLVPAVAAFSFAPALDMNQPTPWLGATERLAQYAYEAWQVVLSLSFLRTTGRTAATTLPMSVR